ncbi:MAG: histidine ammonia-lyase [Synergistaceae bacterium]|nr:histidine ammonia-lyase [Synergistaceae bacterium]
MTAAKAIILDGQSLTLDDIVKVVRGKAKIGLSKSAITAVKKAAAVVNEWSRSNDIVYGITTGFGKLASIKISPQDRQKLQENLLLSHACGVGEAFSEEITRAVMLLRINTLSRGFSGISLNTLQGLIDLLNAGIHPVIPCQGSVGSSGDLCPLSHLAIALLGVGDVRYKGRKMNAGKALAAAGLKPLKLEAKEGLALNNGTTVMTAIAALCVIDGLKLAKLADIAASMSIEAMHGVPYAFDPRTHALRPFKGQGNVALNLRRIMNNSQIVEKYKLDRVQDAYSMRCVPQVHGASRDAFDFIRSSVEIEINAVTDNPLIFPDDREALSGGNFHGQPMALGMDFFGIAMAEIASISERRQARLVDSSLSDLPPFLIPDSGLNSGYMIPQYTSAALVSENKVLAHPSCVDSIPTSANQEDHVSMGGYSARKASVILDNTRKVLAIEFLMGAQALDFNEGLKPGDGTVAARSFIRKHIKFLEKDEYLHPLIMKMYSLLIEEELLGAVESVIGRLD